MKPTKIILLSLITILTLFVNINNVSAGKSKAGKYEFKSSNWSLEELKKNKVTDLCNIGTSSCSAASNTVSCYAICTIKFKNPNYIPGSNCDKTITASFHGQPGGNIDYSSAKYKCNNKTLTFESSYIKTRVENSGWNSIIVKFPTKSNNKINAKEVYAQRLLVSEGICPKDNKGKYPKSPLGNICKYGEKQDLKDAAQYAGQTYTNDGENVKDKVNGTKEKVTEEEAKKILKGEMKSTNCKELLGDDLVEILQSLVDIVKVAVPILLIALGTLDFGKAIFSSDDNEMKKAQSKFMKRLLAAAAIFLVPSLLGVLLNLGHSIWGDVIKTDLCGIKF